MLLDCKIIERTSKAGNPYVVLQIDIGLGCKKDVFLNDSEKAILALQQTADNAAL